MINRTQNIGARMEVPVPSLQKEGLVVAPETEDRRQGARRVSCVSVASSSFPAGGNEAPVAGLAQRNDASRTSRRMQAQNPSSPGPDQTDRSQSTQQEKLLRKIFRRVLKEIGKLFLENVVFYSGMTSGAAMNASSWEEEPDGRRKASQPPTLFLPPEFSLADQMGVMPSSRGRAEAPAEPVRR